MTTLGKTSEREARERFTFWFTCCGETVRHYDPYRTQIRCNKCNELVEAGDHPDDAIELEDAQ